ncbi:hypothetical protein ACFFSW_35685 [Saccharothrix longispora]|uniref:Uncharacterized protein n=1 Tax=Saccharothrix longispora TaxID=33920 RepID=A0ABU1PTS5_9PSEU|nr:hypothetical protein [Saccharothrix longispora]MDR6594042.1 hypothetical protein [Saccharothrix longispora]
MRWSLWLVQIGLLLGVPGTARWVTVVPAALATGALALGYGAQRRHSARLLRLRGDDLAPGATRPVERGTPTAWEEFERQRFRAIAERLQDEDREFAARIRALDRAGGTTAFLARLLPGGPRRARPSPGPDGGPPDR